VSLTYQPRAETRQVNKQEFKEPKPAVKRNGYE